jgi:hypothetical protein
MKKKTYTKEDWDNEVKLLRPLGRQILPNELVIEIHTDKDKEGMQTITMYWYSTSLGYNKNLTGNQGQVFLTDLDERIKSAKKENKEIIFLPNKFGYK